MYLNWLPFLKRHIIPWVPLTGLQTFLRPPGKRRERGREEGFPFYWVSTLPPTICVLTSEGWKAIEDKVIHLGSATLQGRHHPLKRSPRWFRGSPWSNLQGEHWHEAGNFYHWLKTQTSDPKFHENPLISDVLKMVQNKARVVRIVPKMQCSGLDIIL